jgi:uncharacterized protein (DUF1778 family)
MVAKKTDALNVRIDPDLKEVLRTASKREGRSIANMIEILIIRHAKKVGITIPEQYSLFEETAGE